MDVPVKGRMRRVQVISARSSCCILPAWPRRDCWSSSTLIGIFPKILFVDILVLIAPIRSMADQDTDRYIFEVNAIDLRRKMRNLEDTVQWTDLV